MLPPSVASFGADLVEIYATALDQDFEMLADVQRGLRAAGDVDLVLTSQERRILHWNATLDAYLEGAGFDERWRVRLAGRPE